MTKHQYYLQLRKDILEEKMRCDTTNAMILASLALQAEFGDYQPEVINKYRIYMIKFILMMFCISIITFFNNGGAFTPASWEDLLQAGALPLRVRPG